MLVLQTASEIPSLNEILGHIHDSWADKHGVNIMPWHSSQLQARLLIACPAFHVFEVRHSCIVVVLSREDLGQEIGFNIRHWGAMCVVASVAEIQAPNTGDTVIPLD